MSQVRHAGSKSGWCDRLKYSAYLITVVPTARPPNPRPWRLTLVTVTQFVEGLSDRQTADAVRSRIDWKYALSLELTEEYRLPKGQEARARYAAQISADGFRLLQAIDADDAWRWLREVPAMQTLRQMWAQHLQHLATAAAMNLVRQGGDNPLSAS